MKLLFFIEHFKLSGSGAENDAVKICTAMSKMGHDVHVVADFADDFESITTYKNLKNIDQIIKDISPDKTIDWGFFHKADIHRLGGGVHKDFLSYNLNAYHGISLFFKELSYKKKKHKETIKKESKILKNPNAKFLSISNFVSKQAIKNGADPSNIKLLYNGVSLSKFNNEIQEKYREKIRNLWRIKKNDIVYLFIAHNLKLKNIQLIKKIFDEIYINNNNIKLIVCGKRKPSFSTPYLIYTGISKNISELYAASDVLLHPSFFDSFANVVLEAMACGLPCVVSKDAGVSELIEDKKDGFILPVTTDNVLKIWQKAILDLKEASLRTKIGRNALLKAKEYSDKTFFKEFNNFIEQ